MKARPSNPVPSRRPRRLVAAVPEPIAADPASPPAGGETQTIEINVNDVGSINRLLSAQGLGPENNHISPLQPHIAHWHQFAPSMRIAPASLAHQPDLVQYLVEARFCCRCGRIAAKYVGDPQSGCGPYLVFESPSAQDQLHLPNR